MRRVVVTGIGLISSLGRDTDELFNRLMNAESGIRPVQVIGAVGEYKGVVAAVDFDPKQHLPSAMRVGNLDRVSQLSLAAAIRAVGESGIEFDNDLRDRTGISVGTGYGSGCTMEESYEQLLLKNPDRLKPLTVLKAMGNASASHVALHFKLNGPNHTYFCACASSTVAIGEAARKIRHGYADAMIAGGAESVLSYGMLKSWEAMRVMANSDPLNPSSACKPFSKNRTGLVLGEGAAMVILEERDAAKRRGARIYGELLGYGTSNDSTHIAAPTVEGQAQAMTLALSDAGISANEIDYINAHGTATLLNDVTETRAIRKVFGAQADKLPVSSTKSMHGHLLGGSGALELIVSLLAINNDAVPPTAHMDEPDPECDLDYVPGRGRYNQKIGCVMSNSFAFGGTNAVLIASKDM